MDVSDIDDVIYWINRQPEWEVVDTAEVVRSARDAEIPQAARDALQDLPIGIWSRADLVAEVRDLMVPRIER